MKRFKLRQKYILYNFKPLNCFKALNTITARLDLNANTNVTIQSLLGLLISPNIS